MLRILSPAKINLFLEIKGRRSDGYHTLRTLMCPVGIYDRIELDFSGSQIRVSCSHPAVPQDETNLAWQAAALFFARLSQRRRPETLSGLNVRIEKQIPVAAGLGGGSSNAAAVMIGLNRYCGEPFSLEEMAAMGLEIGADTPFFIRGCPAIATGIGERLQPYTALKPYPVLIIYPGIPISTAEVYKNLDLALTNCKKKLKDFPLKQAAFDPARHACNDLETVTLSRFEDVRTAKLALLKHGASVALMSGSGSAVFGLFDDSRRAREAHAALINYKSWKVFFTELVTKAGCIVR
jgi:4-diphosphocytidyl-2-C-methyl-D-erythritol kinase